MELVHVEYQREPAGRTLRIYLDKPGGVTLDDCANISRQLSDLLDVGLETEASYRMEVSSPGVQRPLGRLGDFERFKGSRAKVRTSQALEGRKNFTGTLQGLSGLSVLLWVDNQTLSIAFTDIVKAHLIH
jgi:ribosome maturation factor RimP